MNELSWLSFVYRYSEARFWNFPDRVQAGLPQYAIPKAALDEILIEKTPDYLYGRANVLEARALDMKMSGNPNMKLIVFLCDPVERAFSHLAQKSLSSIYDHLYYPL